MKVLQKFITRVIRFIISKVAKTLAAGSVFAVIPGPGWIITAASIIWTAIEIIMLVWPIYEEFKKNPQFLDICKVEVFNWLNEKFSFIKDLCDIGKKIFKMWMDAYKKSWHAVGNLLFTSNKKMYAARKANEDALIEISKNKLAQFKPIPANVLYSRFVGDNGNLMKRTLKVLTEIEEYNTQLEQEDDSWWRDTDQMTKWLNERHKLFLQLIGDLLPMFGVIIVSGFFEKLFVENTRAKLMSMWKSLREQIEEEVKQRELQYFKNMKLDFEETKKILKQLFESSEKRSAKIQELKNTIYTEQINARARFEKIFPEEFGDDIDFGDLDEEENEENSGAIEIPQKWIRKS